MAFASPILQGSTRLDNAAGGGPSIKPAPPHDDPDAVKRIQRALAEVGYLMTKSFPNGPGTEPDGKFGQETLDAVLDLQKRKFPSEPSQWDGRVGRNTLGKMDGMLANGEKVVPGPKPGPQPGPKPGPNPTPPSPPDGKCIPLDDTIPTGSPYSEIPADTMTILQRSYRERNGKNMNLVDGFEDSRNEPCPQSKVTFRQVLDKLRTDKPFAVLGEMRTRCESKVPGLWKKIKWLHDIYDFGTSRGIWCCLYPDQIMEVRKQLKESPHFCSDMYVGHSTHQNYPRINTTTPSQCYRELGKVSEAGLHVCMMVGSVKNSEFGEWQNIHVDPHQIGGGKGKKCACWYAKTKHHFGDVGQWCVNWFLDNHGNKTEVKAALYVLDVDPNDRVGAYKKLMDIIGDYDTLVDMADHPEKYHKPWDVKNKAKLVLAGLYKDAYMNFMPPQYDP